ncbi:MAG: DUF2339 domain-containing protein [Pseudomonadota bacterium]
MTFFFVLVLACAVTFVWIRADRLERQLAILDERLDALAHANEQLLAGSVAVSPTSAGSGVADTPSDLEAPPQPFQEPESVEATEPADNTPADPLAKVAQNARDEFQTQATLAPEPQIDQREPSTSGLEEVDEPSRSLSFDFEDIFGRRLPIWGGGFALAIAGIFLVRFSIEAGLLTPTVRVALSFVFGLGLLGGAEAAFRFEERLRDPRVRQSLSGAGLATLYGAFYLAGTAYGLIGAGAAFVGLATVTTGAIALSFRFGLPSAVIGLVGGFAAPLLVNSESANVPLLSFYLALVTGGLAWTGQAQGFRWMSYAALAAGLVWGALMMLAGVEGTSDFAALGLYLVVLGTVLPAFLHARGGPSLPHLIGGAVATLQMAVLVSEAGFDPLTWGLYLLISAALTVLGSRYEALRLGAAVASGLGLWLLVVWPNAEPSFYAAIAVAQIVIFAGVPLVYQALGRAKQLDLAQLSAVSVIMACITYARFGNWGDIESEPLLAFIVGTLALLPAAAFAFVWKRSEEGETRTSLTLLAPAYGLIFASLIILAPAWLAPAMALLAGLPVVALYWKREGLALSFMAWTSAAVSLLALAFTPAFPAELSQLGEGAELVDTLRASLRWASVALAFLSMAVIGRSQLSRRIADAASVALFYGVIAQIVPSQPLAWIAALAAIGLHVWKPQRFAAWGSALAIAVLWAAAPFSVWALAGLLALVGEPFLASSVVSLLDLALRVAPVASAMAALTWSGRGLLSEVKVALSLALGLIALVMTHSLYKQAFDINSMLAFAQDGMAERTIWQAALALVAYGVSQSWRGPERPWIALGLIAASCVHFVWFTLFWHNPLFVEQHVGPTPIANWLTLGYSLAVASLWLGCRLWQEAFDQAPPRAVAQGCDVASMTLITLLAYSLLRQVFAGSVLIARPIDQTESLLISLLGIVLALAFLAWGSWKANRSWRIGSLVLMLAAVVKVFLIDAAGLGGLLRIASFMALGFSLIGIGWFYSKQLTRQNSLPS